LAQKLPQAIQSRWRSRLTLDSARELCGHVQEEFGHSNVNSAQQFWRFLIAKQETPFLRNMIAYQQASLFSCWH
jgi:hypothetical protein